MERMPAREGDAAGRVAQALERHEAAGPLALRPGPGGLNQPAAVLGALDDLGRRVGRHRAPSRPGQT